MKTFREFVSEATKQPLEPHAQGTYVSAHCSEDTKAKIAEFSRMIVLNNPAPATQYHTTVIYSRTGVPEVEDMDFPNNITGKFKEWKIFDSKINGTKCLVAAIDSPELVKLHEKIMDETDATYDFDDYIPHVTLTYDYDRAKVPIETPDFEFTFSKIIAKPLDPTFVPSKDKPES